MSGIAGVFYRDGKPASTRAVDEMLNSIQHRGPDGRGVWSRGPVALGHVMLHVTPESLTEHMPLVDAESGLALTADARIDNRDELAAELGIKTPLARVTDSELIMATYRKWGRACASHLIGDFCFALWDEHAQEFFLARDPMGVRNVHFFHSDRMFAFASEIKGLLALSGIPCELNEARVGDFLINYFEDREHTFYRGLFRLPSASTLRVTREYVEIREYWTPDPVRELRLSSDAEYTEAFRDCFLHAVKARVRSAFPVGSALSGGLDSSAIACATRPYASQPVHTFSAVFPGLPAQDLAQIDERPFMDLVLRQGGFEHHPVEADKLSPMADVDRVHHHLDEANFAPNLYLHWSMYKAAQQSGARVFLDGFDGDSTVSYGFDHLIDLARGLRWGTLWNEASQLSNGMLQGRSPRWIVWEFAAKSLAPAWMFGLRRLLRGDWKSARANPTLIDQRFIDKFNLKARAQQSSLGAGAWETNAREKHAATLRYPLFSQTLEMADKASAAFSVEARYPFFDRRLIELCLALPANQKLGAGWSRLILRRAMEGILPPEIQWRPSKGNLSPNFHRRFLDFERHRLDELIFRNPEPVKPYIDISALRAAYRRYGAEPLANAALSMPIFSVANLSCWLRAAGFAR